jgi:hypothetical protein
MYATFIAIILPLQPTCDNHDDGDTVAIILCTLCGNLCADCDRYLHLHRRTRTHQRQVILGYTPNGLHAHFNQMCRGRIAIQIPAHCRIVLTSQSSDNRPAQKEEQT